MTNIHHENQVVYKLYIYATSVFAHFQVHSSYLYDSKRVDANITKNDGKCHQSYKRTTKENKILLGSMIFKVNRISRYAYISHFKNYGLIET